MVECQYANAYNIYELFAVMMTNELNKQIKRGLNKDYVFEYDPKKTLNEQNVSKTAKAIIGILFRDYWATETQKDKIISKQKYDRQQIEVKKQEKYNPDNIFKNKSLNPNQERTINNTVAMITYKESIFKKILNKIKSIFNK